MDIVAGANPHKQFPLPPQQARRPRRANTARELGIVRARDFKTTMQFIAANDLWDELELEFAVHGVNRLRISAEAMQLFSHVVRRKVSLDELPAKTPMLLGWCDSIGGSSGGGSKPSAPLTPGTSEGGDAGAGDAGSKDKLQ